jgi:hypothetical protein
LQNRFHVLQAEPESDSDNNISDKWGRVIENIPGYKREERETGCLKIHGNWLRTEKT